MKPLNFIALLLFLAGATWALTRSERTVREIQAKYYACMVPFLRTGSSIEQYAQDFLKETERSKKLEAELQVMKEQRDRLRIIESRYRSLESENALLQKALKFKESTQFNVIPARVTRRNPTTWWETVEIDAGSNRGIGVQLAVLSNEGLVGKIDRVDNSGDRSSVLLLTDEKCLVSARIEGTPEVGIVAGQRGGYEGESVLRMKYLSPNAMIQKGQRVFTTGRGGIFPPNILLGTIISVEKNAFISEALVRPAVNFGDLGAVFVVSATDS